MISTPADSRFFANEIIGNCVLLKPLRVREKHEVWRVFDRKRHLSAVLKLIHMEHRRAEILPDLIRSLHSLDSSRLVKVLDFQKTGCYYAVELEYAAGGTLAQMLRRQGRFSLAQTVFIMREVLMALTLLHGCGIIHRDIKPGNIMLSAEGFPKLGDFSIARLKSHPEKGPQVFGTPSAMSPEQTSDSTQADERSDFFSLASMIWQLLTGKPRFPRVGFVETLKIIRDSDPDRFQEELGEYATADLISLLAQMSANRPSERPESAEFILGRLDRMHLPCAGSIPCKTAEEQPEPQRGRIGET